MAFRDWSDEDYQRFYDDAFATVYNTIESVPYLSDEDQETAESLFATGWLDFYVSPDEREAAREEFYLLTGLPEEDFDWEEYRASYDEVNG